jgi:predicted DNA-binding transcriptional regulator AlpA
MLLRFPDLAQYGVHNWPTLLRWIDKQGAPAGFYLSSNTRVWHKAEWDAWLEAKAKAPKPSKRRAA